MRLVDLKVGILSYYVSLDCVYALLVDENSSDQMYKLASWSEIFPKIDKFLEAMEGGYPPRRLAQIFKEFTHGWGKSLLPPFPILAAYDIIIIIPHYELHALPLHTIWIDEAGNYLGIARAISYCSSATLLNRCVMGNSERQQDLSKWAFFPDSGKHRHAPKRPQVACGYGVDIKTGKNELYLSLANLFTRSFKKGQFGWIHPRFSLKARHMNWQAIGVVCHGLSDDVNPDFSGLLLDRQLGMMSKVPRRLHRDQTFMFHDLPYRDIPFDVQVEPERVAELMTVAELKVELDTDANLVALLGCSTGSGHLLSGDDFNSLAYQWLKLGSASVLASMWELDFDFIMECLPLFLENWLKGRQPKALALRQALRTMLSRHPELEPYEWGVLILLGDWL